MEANPLDPIRRLINAGDQPGARIALAELLKVEPDNADAWALLAILLPRPAEQARCYREILRINPNDRQAKVWLESLTGQPTEPQARVGPSAEEAKESAAEGVGIDQLLAEVALPGFDDDTLQPLSEPETPQRQVEHRGFLDRLLGRLRGRTVDPDEAEALVMGPEELTSTAGSLSPELVLRLAGGPLAPDERRNCPHCDAVVSRREARCPWCSAPLPDTESQ
jgi:tetratricopeptide (TPR) repeat protein